MAKEYEIPRTNPTEIENLIEQIRGTNLEPSAKEKVERLLRTVLTLVELLQRKNTSIKKLREMIFGKRTERHQARKTEGREKVDECEKSDDGRPKAAGDQDARAELRAIGSEDKPKRKGHGRRAASDYSGAKIVRCRHERLKAGDDCPAPCGGWLYDLNEPTRPATRRKKAACGFFRTEVRAERLIRSFFNLLGSSFKTRPTSEGG